MNNPYGGDAATPVNPISGGGFSTEHVAGALVIGALVFLILVGRGFRGVNAGGLSVGVR